jgi:hypothetical protein
MPPLDDNDLHRRGALPDDPAADATVVSRSREEEMTDRALAAQLPRVLERLRAGLPRAPTGWPLLDRALCDEPALEREKAPAPHGFVVPSLNVLGAPPKVGKSTWAQIVAERHAEAGGVAYYVDLENGVDRFMRRLLYRRARLGAAALRRGMTLEQNARWQRAVAGIERGALGQRLFLETRRQIDGAALASCVEALRDRAEGRALLVVVDSLHKLPMEMQNRRDGVDHWLRVLEEIRDRSGAVILAISELRRRERGGHDVSETGFKESGGIEYSGDLLLALEPPGGAEPIGGSPAGETPRLGAPATLRIVFNRDGLTGKVAQYRAEFPWYGLVEEGLPEPSQPPVPADDGAGRVQPARPDQTARPYAHDV